VGGEGEKLYWCDISGVWLSDKRNEGILLIPRFFAVTATPKGGVLSGPRSVRAEFWDTGNNSVEIVELEPVAGNSGGKKVTWALSETKHTFSDVHGDMYDDIYSTPD